MYQKNVGYGDAVSPMPDGGTKAVRNALLWRHIFSSPSLVPPPILLSGNCLPGPVGAENSHWLGNRLLIELEFEGDGTCAERLAANPSVNATTSIVVKNEMRNERLNQAMSKEFKKRAGYCYKDGRTPA